jgi:hypothetical protein
MRLAQRTCQNPECDTKWTVHLSGWMCPKRKAALHQPSNECPECGTKWTQPPAPPMSPEEQVEWDKFRDAMPIRNTSKEEGMFDIEITEIKSMKVPSGDIFFTKSPNWKGEKE